MRSKPIDATDRLARIHAATPTPALEEPAGSVAAPEAVPSLRPAWRGSTDFVESLPALDYVKRGVVGRPLADFVVFGVQHLLASKVPFFKALTDLGVSPRNLRLLGVPYSSNAEVVARLRQQGHHVNDGRFDVTGRNARLHGKDGYHEARLVDVSMELHAALRAAKSQGKKLLVLDDGGMVSLALKKIIEREPEVAGMVKVVEQTTRGITEVKDLDLPFPVIDVARSEGKRVEAQHIGRQLAASLQAQWLRLGVSNPAGMRVTVVGYGWVGEALVEHLQRLGCLVTVVEKDPLQRERVPRGVATASSVAEVAESSQALIGCTGERSITMEDLERLPPNAIVASGSSAEVELPMEALRQRSDRDPFAELGETRCYKLRDKPIFMIADGRPANFDHRNRNSVDPDYIQLTLGLMLMGALQAATATGRHIQPLGGDQQGLIELVEGIWKQRPPAPVTVAPAASAPPPPGPRVADALALDWSPDEHGRYHAAWVDYLGGVSEVVPRLGFGSRFYRTAEGELRFVDLRPLARGYRPIAIPGIAGTLLDVDWLGGAPFVKLVTQVNGEQHEWYLRHTPLPEHRFELAFSRPRPSGFCSFVRQRDVLLMEGDADQLSLRSLGQGRIVSSARLRHGEGVALFDVGPIIAGDVILGENLVVRAAQSPPSLTVLSRGLSVMQEFDLSQELESCDVTYAHNDSMVVSGRGRGGRRVVVMVHIASGRQVRATLPAGAGFERVRFNPQARRWEAVLLGGRESVPLG